MSDIQLKGGYVTKDRRLDRLPEQDERSRAYGIRALLPEAAVLPAYKYWSAGQLIDQGNEGACVGFGFAGEYMSSPYRTHIGPYWAKAYSRMDPNDFAREKVYYRARQIDAWPGEDYDGTSVLAGAKVSRELGLIPEYRWAFSMADVRDTVALYGPVVIGINWYENMYQTKSNGLVDVSGEFVGGHCLFINGWSRAKSLTGFSQPQEVFRWRNSWGPYYGLNGHGIILASDLHRLLIDEDGDMCVPVTRVAGNV